MRTSSTWVTWSADSSIFNEVFSASACINVLATYIKYFLCSGFALKWSWQRRFNCLQSESWRPWWPHVGHEMTTVASDCFNSGKMLLNRIHAKKPYSIKFPVVYYIYYSSLYWLVGVKEFISADLCSICSNYNPASFRKYFSFWHLHRPYIIKSFYEVCLICCWSGLNNQF